MGGLRPQCGMCGSDFQPEDTGRDRPPERRDRPELLPTEVTAQAGQLGIMYPGDRRWRRPAVLVSVGNGREAMSDQVDVSVQFRSTGPRDALKPARYGAHGRSPSGPRDVGYYPSTVDSHIASSVTTRPAVQVHRCRYMRWEARSGRRDAGRRWWSRLLVVRVLWVRVPRAHYYPGSARCPKACRGRLAWAVGAPVGGI